MNRLVTIAALVVISLIPAILLYYLFGSLNTAGVEWAGKSVQLGGPVAAFFATLLFIARLFAKLSAPSPLQKRLEALQGTWTIESISHGPSRRMAYSSTVMKIDNGFLTIEGGTFRDSPAEGKTEGAIIGGWSSEIAVSDGLKLSYVYNLTDDKTRTWKGVATTVLNTDKKTPTFDGTWQVFGKEFHQGEIHLTKAATPK